MHVPSAFVLSSLIFRENIAFATFASFSTSTASRFFLPTDVKLLSPHSSSWRKQCQNSKLLHHFIHYNPYPYFTYCKWDIVLHLFTHCKQDPVFCLFKHFKRDPVLRLFTQCKRDSVEFFTVCTKLAEMAILYSKHLTTAKKSYFQWGLT